MMMDAMAMQREPMRLITSHDPEVREEGLEQLKGMSAQSLTEILATLSYLAAESPLLDVRQACAEAIGAEEQEMQVSPVSSWMDPGLFWHSRLTGKQTEVLSDAFFASGRVLNMERLMGLHPEYLEAFQRTHRAVAYGSGPLPVSWRMYILILAAAHVDSHCVVELFQHEFREHGGEKAWLAGIDFAPGKLQKLLPVMSLLAQSPWLLTAEHLEDVLSAEQGDAWSTGEFVHALALMVTGDMLGKISKGCGLARESFLVYGAGLDLARSDSGNLIELGTSTTPTAGEGSGLDMSGQTQEVFTKLQAGVEKFKNEEELMTDAFGQCDSASEGATKVQISQDLSVYVAEHTAEHTDFDCSSKASYGIYHVEDFPWDSDVAPRLDRYYTGIGTLLDQEFRTIRELTYNTFREIEGVDTQPFRHAIWYYSTRIMGLFHDDYDYREVNLLVNIEFKKYLKKVTCLPQETTVDDFTNVGYDLPVSEKVHALLIAVEARKYSSLMYGVRALNQYVNNR